MLFGLLTARGKILVKWDYGAASAGAAQVLLPGHGMSLQLRWRLGAKSSVEDRVPNPPLMIGCQIRKWFAETLHKDRP